MSRKRKPPYALGSLKPITIDGVTWMYPERKGLCMVREGVIFYIPWSKIIRAVSVREVSRKRKKP